MSKKILHINVRRVWFDQIASGKKKIEYREVKRHWHSRLTEPDVTFGFDILKKFDEIHIRNGYHRNARLLVVKHIGTTRGKVVHPDTKKYCECYCIHLGDILETRYMYEKRLKDKGTFS